MTKTIIRAAAIAIIASSTALIAVPAAAESINADGKHEMTLKFDDAMLATPRGVNRLRENMQRTARRSCLPDAPSAAAVIRSRVCFAELTEAGNRAITVKADQWAARNNQAKSLALAETSDD